MTEPDHPGENRHPIRALTLHQPWASLVAVGVKRIETRSWSTKYRGPLAIHAGAKPLGNRALYVGDGRTGWTNVTGEPIAVGQQMMSGGINDLLLCPLGVIVATCTLADVVPILAAEQDPCPGGDEWVRHVAPVRPLGDLSLWDGPTYPENPSTGRPTWSITNIEDQRPYGDYTPGRYAWLLEDIKDTDARCPACWGVDGVVCFRCMGLRGCDPIPAKGKQGLWTTDLLAPGQDAHTGRDEPE